jgi:hypothetical protein
VRAGGRSPSRRTTSSGFTGAFTVAGGGECRFIPLVTIGRNHCRDDQFAISASEIFGMLVDDDNVGDPSFVFHVKEPGRINS